MSLPEKKKKNMRTIMPTTASSNLPCKSFSYVHKLECCALKDAGSSVQLQASVVRCGRLVTEVRFAS